MVFVKCTNRKCEHIWNFKGSSKWKNPEKPDKKPFRITCSICGWKINKKKAIKNYKKSMECPRIKT